MMAMHKLFLTLGVFTLLLVSGPASAQETDINTLIRVVEDSQTRIQRLERTVDDLQAQIRDLQDQLAAIDTGVTDTPADPIVGSWECTNNVFTYAMSFTRNGQVVQQEPTFGNARNTNWSRLSEAEITIAGHVVVGTDFFSDDSLSMTDTRNNTTWECNRQ